MGHPSLFKSMAFLCACTVHKTPFIFWKHAELSVLPKEFPPALYWRLERSGLCQSALWSESVWRLHSDPLTTRKNSVHACAHLLCFSFLLFFPRLCWFYSLLPELLCSEGWSQRSSFGFIQSCSWKWPSPQHGLRGLCFLLSCSHIFLALSEPGWTQLLSSQRAQRKLSQAANCLAGCCICSAERGRWSHEADVCVCMCTRAC